MMRPHRGSALIAALIVIAVMATVTVATLRLASISKGQSLSDARKLSQSACVDAARQYLISRLRLLSKFPLTELTFDQAIPVENGTRHLYTGHARQNGPDGRPPAWISPPTAGTPVIESVRAVAASKVGGGKAGNRDLSNTIAPPTLGGKPYQVIVACSDPVAGDLELEFSFRYGL
jgi:hypothetical protein